MDKKMLIENFIANKSQFF